MIHKFQQNLITTNLDMNVLRMSQMATTNSSKVTLSLSNRLSLKQKNKTTCLKPMLKKTSTKKRHSTSLRVQANKADIVDRIIGSTPYLLPLFDSWSYGIYFFESYPGVYTFLSPLFPLLQLYKSIPLSSVILFFAIYLGMSRNQNLSGFVRFNAMQAILLDILLIVPRLALEVFRFPYNIQVGIYNTVWLFILICFVYAVGSCIMGQVARLPLVSEASDAQIR